MVDLGRRLCLWGLIDLGMDGTGTRNLRVDPSGTVAPPGVPADLVDDAGWNVLFYAVKEAFSQLTAFLLGALML